jgi:hypothetical protein
MSRNEKMTKINGLLFHAHRALALGNTALYEDLMKQVGRIQAGY